MKKITIFLLLGLLLLIPSVKAQTDTLTVADGNATSMYYPIYGSYMNSYLHSQIIYPESMLEDMVGSTLSSITFYATTPLNTTKWRSIMRVKLGTTSVTSYSTASFVVEPMQSVYLDSIAIVNSLLKIVFDTGFVYTGGNLLVDISTEVQVTGANSYQSATFRCMSTTDYMGIKGYNSQGVESIGNQQRYKLIPKTTFVFSGGSTCLSPNDVEVDSVTQDYARLIIHPRSGQSEWEYMILEAGSDTSIGYWTTTTDTMVTLLGLTENTSYEAYVRTHCGTDVSPIRMVPFHTDCLPIDTVSVTWDFESHLTGNYPYFYPACWSRLYSASDPYVYTSSAHAFSGTYVLYFPANSLEAVAVLPEIDTVALPMNTLQLSFRAKLVNQSHTCDVEVGTVEEQNGDWVFIPFDTIADVTGSYGSEVYTVLLDQYVGNSNRLAFRKLNPSEPGAVLCVDDVVLDAIPPCPKVQHLTVSAVAEQTASLTWHGVSDSYAVRYRKTNYPYWTDTIVTTASISLSGLQSNTTYLLQVAPGCEIITDDMYRQIMFTTDCGPMPLPYLVTFEDANYESCWTVLTEGVVEYSYYYDSYYPAVVISSSDAHGGSKYLQIGAQDSSYAVLASPKLAPPIETVVMTLYARRQSSLFYSYVFGEFQVGLMNSLSDSAVFLPVATIPVTGTSYTSYSVDFSQSPYTGTGYHVVFRYVGSGMTDSVDVGCLFVDDILFNTISTCNAPASVSFANVTQTTADVSWSGSANSYHVYYKPMNSLEYLSGPVTSAQTVTLTDLNSSTYYHCYVAAVCADGSESPSSVGTFMTECGTCYDYPYVQDFNSYGEAVMPDCWQKIGGLSEGGYTYPLTIQDYSYSIVANSAPTAMVFASSSSNSAVAIMPHFSENLQQLRLTFAARPEQSSSGTFKAGYMTNPSDRSTFVEVRSIETSSLINYNYQEYLVDFANVPYMDTAYIAFLYESGSTSGFLLDDVVVDVIPDCAPAIQLVSSAVLSTSANLAWLTNAEQVELFYKAASDTEYYSQTASLNSEGYFEVTGLLPSTTYLWYVVVECEGESYYSDTVSFITDCAGINALPVTWGFESAGNTGPSANPIPFCWHRIHSIYPYSYQTTLYNYAHSGTRCLNFPVNTGNLYAALPALDTSVFSLDTLQLKFYARVHSSSEPYTLEVGVMNDPMDASTFVPVQSVPITAAAYQTLPFRVNFDQYQGSGYYVAFRCQQTSYGNVYVDDVTLQVRPDCEPVLSMSVDDITITTANVSWVPSDANSDYVVSYKPTSATSWTTILVSDTLTTLVNLTPATQYDVKVVPDCGDAVQELSMTFTTRCEPVLTFPYQESFEDGTFGCWYDSTAIDNGSKWRVCSFNCNAQFSQDGNYHAYLTPSPSNTHSAVYLISPVLDLTLLATPTLVFYYDALGYGNYTDSLSLFYRTSPTSPWIWLAGYEDRDDYLVQWSVDSIELPSPTSSYQIAFLGSSSNGDGVYVDNIHIFDNIPVIQPSVQTYSASNITTSTATLSGEIVDLGNQPILSQGFAWKASADADYNIANVNGIVLTHGLQDLAPATIYTYHAFATTAIGTVTGQEVTFTTADPPTCPAPYSLTYNVDHTNVTLTWQQEPNTANEWQINYRQSTESTWNTVTATTTSYTLIDLAANVQYVANVVAHCTNGLTSGESNTVTFETNNIGIEDYLAKAVKLYPNPATQLVNVECEAGSEATSIEVYNVYGQLLMTLGTEGQHVTQIPVSGLADGMYYVRVTTDNGVVTKSFVKR